MSYYKLLDLALRLDQKGFSKLADDIDQALETLTKEAAIDYQTAMASLKSKATFKKVKELLKLTDQDNVEQEVKSFVDQMVKTIETLIKDNDYRDADLGVVVIWLKNYILNSPSAIINTRDVARFLEKFFLVQTYVPAAFRDVLKINNKEELINIIRAAEEKYQAAQKGKLHGSKYNEKLKKV
jgi:hypothetical protein